jgi:hypothetical protein
VQRTVTAPLGKVEASSVAMYWSVVPVGAAGALKLSVPSVTRSWTEVESTGSPVPALAVT